MNLIVQVSNNQSGVMDVSRRVQNPKMEYLINKFCYIIFRQILILDLESLKIWGKYTLNDWSKIADGSNRPQNLRVPIRVVKAHCKTFIRTVLICDHPIKYFKASDKKNWTIMISAIDLVRIHNFSKFSYLDNKIQYGDTILQCIVTCLA